tara:strand:- start:478 stop:969 length:492 start_codon:yes stop_codon:yes gene_type:complete
MYILRPDIPEEEVDTHLKKYSGILTDAGAEILDNQMRGKRRLAYPIAKHKEGIYVQLSHNGDGQHVGVLEKAMRISEDVIRYLTVKQNGPLPTPRVVQNSETKSDDKSEGKVDKSSEKVEAKEEKKEEKKVKAKEEKKEEKKVEAKEEKAVEAKEEKKEEEKE